jgi:hypothetical protein
MKRVCIEAHYLPSLEFFCAIRDFDVLRLEVSEHFVKQSYRSRCNVLTAQGGQMLSIPLTAKHGKVPLRDVQLDYNPKWQTNHWRTGIGLPQGTVLRTLCTGSGALAQATAGFFG